MLAAREGRTEAVLVLCESGKADIGRRDGRGRDAVMYASARGHDTIVQILLTHAPPPSTLSSYLNPPPPTRNLQDPDNAARALLAQSDEDGNTALHFAASYGHLAVLRTLLAAGADSERRNCWSWRAVSYSATVAAEVYFKGLVGEVEGWRDKGREDGKGGIRVVDGGEI